MELRWHRFALAVCMLSAVSSAAQGPIQPVQWKAAEVPTSAVRPGARVVIELSAEIQKGWHVYGLVQSPGGPTPLRFTLDANEIAQLAGTPSGSAPIKKHDAAFDLDTEVYEGSFELHLPVQVNQHPTAGRTLLPMNVRFQACNDRVCLPPRTVRVSVLIEIPHGN